VTERYRGGHPFGKALPDKGWYSDAIVWPGKREAHRLVRQGCPEDSEVARHRIKTENKTIQDHNLGMFSDGVSFEDRAISLVKQILVHKKNGAIPAIGTPGALTQLQAKRPDHELLEVSFEVKYESDEPGSDAYNTIDDVQINLAVPNIAESGLPILPRAQMNVIKPLGTFILSL
jgi:hypothetical protein